LRSLKRQFADSLCSLSSRSYKLVNDSQNINPFPASFLNNRCSIKLRGVTTSNETFVEIHSKFMTDHAMADAMEQTWERMYTSMLSDLNRHMLLANQSAVLQVGHSNHPNLLMFAMRVLVHGGLATHVVSPMLLAS
jgi:hypothetical protein